MKITEMLKKELILEDMQAMHKREALEELIGAFAKGGIRFDARAMLQVLLDREKLGSTGIGQGIAIPHGKLAGLAETVVAFGRSRTGIDFEAMDGKPVQLFFLLVAPENSAGQHLKVLAKISRMLKDGDFRKKLIDAQNNDALLRIITEKDDEL
ncbi:MAG: PTS sugar transporter subunit IIA [Deltaproteobacteria bacterium]|nr:PTS sugar transporter subunit IIA [Deltaproteobacteria bacterium]